MPDLSLTLLPFTAFEGAIQLPGGHLEVGESPEACAVREVAEETGLVVREEDVRFVTATNDIFAREGKHYVTLFVACRVEDDAHPEVSLFGLPLVRARSVPPHHSSLPRRSSSQRSASGGSGRAGST